MNTLGGTGLWNEGDGFYYDQIHADHVTFPVRLRSMVGVIPLFAAEILQQDVIAKLPGFAKRTRWFIDNRPDAARGMSCLSATDDPHRHNRLLAIPTRERLERVLRYVLDENELLSPYGIRSLSRRYADQPYVLRFEGQEYEVRYTPAESATHVFGGNSNWRGPVWFPLNYLLIEALERYHHFYGDDLRVEFPTGSGVMFNLQQVACELGARLSRLFLRDEHGARPCFGADRRYADDPHWRELLLFHEYFDGDVGRGVGASHQTGWTALVARTIEDLVKDKGQP
jgi:glycogen debranching enzyme